MVLSYAKNIGIGKAISSGNLEELNIIWQHQIKDSVKSYYDLFSLYYPIISNNKPHIHSKPPIL